MPRVSSPFPLTLLMCVAQVATLLDAFAFATLIKIFEAEWLLGKAEQGWISGIYFAGYTLAVPVLLAITDRIDARRVYMLGTLIIAVGAGGFALFAEGFWSAMAFRLISGFGLAGAYMPGLRVLVDRYRGQSESRAIAFYTSSWSLGTAMSYFLAGLIGEALGWRAAFWVASASALFAFLLVWLLIARRQPQRAPEETKLLDFRPVLRNRQAMGYVIAYAAHTWELFAFRAWVVAFLAYTMTQQEMTPYDWATPSAIATATALAAMGASVFGNELASRYNRPRVIAVIQIIAASLSCVLGFLAGWDYYLVGALAVLYAVLIQADSASLTAGVVSVAEDGRRGATLAVHNLIGWTGGFLGPLLVGFTLEASGMEDSMSWGLGFICMGAVTYLGAIAVLTLSRSTQK